MAPPPPAAAGAATGKDTDRDIDVQAYISKAQQRNIEKSNLISFLFLLSSTPIYSIATAQLIHNKQ